MVALNKDELPTGAFVLLNQHYPEADWVCGWVDEETCYCVFFYDRDLYCVRFFPVGFGTPAARWAFSVDNTINNCRR